jgi:hypothetical protein
MIIKLDQCLHGYQNGHQLLASSANLLPVENKVLLFQSDLSGSNISDGFESYLTGYPIPESNLYAFSRTWYANEMRRPGCVWTHTVLINFSDLGKIPQLESLHSLFERPIADHYATYETKINFEIEITPNISKGDGFDHLKKSLLVALYEYPNDTILIPSKNPTQFEDVVLQIWSDQWPRLRRNFTFCTGALSLKKLNEKEFDLQIVPLQSISTIERQSQGSQIIKSGDQDGSDWMSILEQNSQMSIRKFLWAYGSDIEGARKNYIPLIRIFYLVNSPNLSLNSLSELITKYFPLRDEAMFCKVDIFGPDSIISDKIKEKELVEYLVTTDKTEFLSFKDLRVDERLVELYKSKSITFSDFIQILKRSKSLQVSNDFWHNIEFDALEILKLIQYDSSLIEIFLERKPEFATETAVWKLDYSLQHRILTSLIYSGKVYDWRPYTYAILNSGSDILFDLKKSIGREIINLSLDWANGSNLKKTFSDDWANEVMHRNDAIFKKWLQSNSTHLAPKVFALIFLFVDIHKLKKFELSSEIWKNGYKELCLNNHGTNIVYVASALLSLGFDNSIKHAPLLVEETFHDVYSYAANSKIDSSTWHLIPQEDIENEEEKDHSFDFFEFFGISTKKKKDIPSWDYCELLIRTLSNKFIKYNWPNQSFLNCLRNQSAFNRAINYCLSFNKGIKLVFNVKEEVNREKIKAIGFQKQILNRIS